MKKKTITLIFDIGKTNKKAFLFDEHLNIVDYSYIRFNQIQDDDGYPTEDINALTEWMFLLVDQIFKEGKYILKYINFSTYGASLVHLNKKRELVTPFYNYMKPLPEDFFNSFFENYGDRDVFSQVTASPILGMLNSGFQLYYLKHYKPELAKNIDYSLHFPQYLSYLFTKKMVSEFTSIGCHTGLWDFTKMEYHSWVKSYGLLQQLPMIVPADYSFRVNLHGHLVNIGVGIHDSSSAMIPYILGSKEPFCLLSTGTWSLSLNPFNTKPLTKYDLNKDCLDFLNFKGEPTRVSRLHLGKEIRYQAKKIANYFKCDYEKYKKVCFSTDFLTKRKNKKQLLFNYEYLQPQLFGYENNLNEELGIFVSFEDAYLNLLDELVDLQIMSIQLTTEFKFINRIFVDGGFSTNYPFLQLLAKKLPKIKIFSSSFAHGSALGAAILMNDIDEIDLLRLFEFKEYGPS